MSGKISTIPSIMNTKMRMPTTGPQLTDLEITESVDLLVDWSMKSSQICMLQIQPI